MSPGPAKQFNREKVLAKAMDLFWSQGYEATGMADLLKHMGIGRQSLYDTFGDKRSLFIQALREYADGKSAEIINQLRAPGSALENVKSLLKHMMALAEDQRGCLMVNVTAECGSQDADIVEVLQQCHQKMEKTFVETFEKAKKQGELRRSADSRGLARLVMTTVQGLALQSKVNSDAGYMESVIQVLLSMMPAK